ncbi:hypothetical protein CP10139811_1035 [Chlamydia ibidis]|uniref:Uncharacterized protein n=2 Tax=Chlamydia ibidis TaxID=1405396 RepID=S7J5Q5_9CHLA|nr:hypothetical protein [Chlamydia ibidis]EPP35412.1 hypothetical protein CP10139811_1035 [Chlamydia ibidis]EQM62967.1 hypothetical protein H359_0354 [Chlamydia ibidis 10-1398/6]
MTSGVGGIGGSGGPQKLPPYGDGSNNDKKDNDGVSSVGGHRFSLPDHGNDTETGPSIRERTDRLLGENFQVRTPEEVEANRLNSSSQSSGRNLLSRMWSSVKQLFSRSQTQGPEISSPKPPAWQAGGRRLPESSAMRAYFLGRGMESCEVGEHDEEEVQALLNRQESVTTHSSEESSSVKGAHGLSHGISSRAKAARNAFLSKVRADWSKLKGKKQSSSEGVSATEESLKYMIGYYTTLIEMADNPEDRSSYEASRKSCQDKLEKLQSVSVGKSLSRLFGKIRGQGSTTPTKADGSLDVENLGSIELTTIITDSQEAEDLISRVGSETESILGQAERMKVEILEGEEPTSRAAELGQRLQSALGALKQGIVSSLRLISDVLRSGARAVVHSCQCVGEAVRRLGHQDQDGNYTFSVSYSRVRTDSTSSTSSEETSFTLDNQGSQVSSDALVEATSSFFEKHGISGSSDGEGGKTFKLPRAFVNSWSSGEPIFMFQNTEVPELTTSESGVEGSQGTESRASGKATTEKRVRFNDNVEVRHIPSNDDDQPYEDMSHPVEEEHIYDLPRSQSNLYDVPRTPWSGTKGESPYVDMSGGTVENPYEDMSGLVEESPYVDMSGRATENPYLIPDALGDNGYMTIYSVPRSLQQQITEEENIYDLPRSESNLYDVPRVPPDWTENTGGYMVARFSSSNEQVEFSTVPGYGLALRALNLSDRVDSTARSVEAIPLPERSNSAIQNTLQAGFASCQRLVDRIRSIFTSK